MTHCGDDEMDHPDVSNHPVDETHHLLHSPENARRILEAIEQIRSGEGRRMTIDELRKEVGLE